MEDEITEAELLTRINSGTDYDQYMVIACSEGYLTAVKTCISKLDNYTEYLLIAIKCGHQEIVEFLLKKFETNCVENACFFNQLAMVKYLHQKGYPITKNCVDSAFERGFVEIFEFCHEKYFGYPYDIDHYDPSNGY